MNTEGHRGKSTTNYHEGDLVLVHHSRVPRWKRNDLDLPYFGPYLITEVGKTTVTVKASLSVGGFVDVGYNQIKCGTAVENEDLEAWEALALEAEQSKAAAEEDEPEGGLDADAEEESSPGMNDEEMKKLDCYKVESILQHKYKQGWRFLKKMGQQRGQGQQLGTRECFRTGQWKRDAGIRAILQATRPKRHPGNRPKTSITERRKGAKKEREEERERKRIEAYRGPFGNIAMLEEISYPSPKATAMEHFDSSRRFLKSPGLLSREDCRSPSSCPYGGCCVPTLPAHRQNEMARWDLLRRWA